MKLLRLQLGALPALGASALLVACGALEPPPVELSFRDSLVGAGKILQIRNTSNEPLTRLEVTLTAPGGESRTYRHETLAGYETVEIGWKKLGGWQIAVGTDIQVRVEGHWRPYEGQLSAPGGDG